MSDMKTSKSYLNVVYMIVLGLFVLSFFLPSAEVAMGDEASRSFAKPGFLVCWFSLMYLVGFGSWNLIGVIAGLTSLGNIFMFLLIFQRSKITIFLRIGLCIQVLLILLFEFLNGFSAKPITLHIGHYIWMWSQIFMLVLVLKMEKPSRKMDD